MGELICRIILAIAVCALPALTPVKTQNGILSFLVLQANLTIFATVLHYRRKSIGAKRLPYETLLACLDVVAWCSYMGWQGTIASWGTLVLIPGILGVRRGADTNILAPVATAAVIGGEALFRTGNNSNILIHAVAVAGGILFANYEFNSRSAKGLAGFDDDAIEGQDLSVSANAYFALREELRQKSNQSSSSEEEAAFLKAVLAVHETRSAAGPTSMKQMLEVLQQATEATSAQLFVVNQHGTSLLLEEFTAGTSQAITKVIPTASRNRAMLQDQASKLLRNDNDASVLVNHCLYHLGTVMGMVSLHVPPTKRDFAERLLSRLNDFLTRYVRDRDSVNSLTIRARQAEILYELALVERGSQSSTELIQRVCKDIQAVHNLSTVTLTRINAGQLESCNSTESLLPQLNLGENQGLKAWLMEGAPEIHIIDAHSDPRFTTEQKRRNTASVIFMPVMQGTSLYGAFELTSSNLPLDTSVVDTARVAAAELSRALERLDGNPNDAEAKMMSESEFASTVRTKSQGFMIIMDVLHATKLREVHGAPALNHALRRLSFRLLSKLPAGGALCRTERGYIAYLPGEELQGAESWANEATVAGTMVGILSSGQRERTPLPLRARVANLNTISEEIPIDELHA